MLRLFVKKKFVRKDAKTNAKLLYNSTHIKQPFIIVVNKTKLNCN